MRHALLAFALLFVGIFGFTQNPGMMPGPARQSPRITDPQFDKHRNGDGSAAQQLERDQEKRRNKDRHAKLKSDTDKLLSLATELKQYVDKTNENVLSLEVMKKAEEIEKLARQVKEKMRESR